MSPQDLRVAGLRMLRHLSNDINTVARETLPLDLDCFLPPVYDHFAEMIRQRENVALIAKQLL